jgi:NTP pyrophosphatase (non-canonical NTP hydrolase)
MIDYVGMLVEFHTKYRHHINSMPTGYVSPFVRDLRLKLMHEELSELEEGLNTNDIVKIADGIADLLYVVFGTAVSYNIPIEEIFAEVHRSNMTKTGPTNDFGKTLKGAEWEPPNIREILAKRLEKYAADSASDR